MNEQECLTSDDINFIQEKLDKIKKDPSKYSGVMFSLVDKEKIESSRIMSDKGFWRWLLSECSEFAIGQRITASQFSSALGSAIVESCKEKFPDAYKEASELAERVVGSFKPDAKA